MRDDRDFDAYLAARWAPLVRTLVLLGGRRDEAEDAVRSGLAACYSSWGPISRGDDPDVHVYRSVLDAWRRRPGTWWEVPDPDPDAEPAPELVMLTRQLDRLTRRDRLALVLRFAAGLEEPQVAAVLDVPLDALPDLVRRALGRIDLTALREVSR